MKKTLIAALLGLMTMTATMAQVNFQTMTITLKNGTVKTYTASQLDSVRFVGGEFNSATGVGVKIYVKNASQSEDYLYSQIESLTTSGSSTVTVDAPVISPAGGMITTPTQVTITCATSGAVIYYTIDGSTPSASSTLYNGPFTVSATTTIKAIAVKDGVSSQVATATYTINSTTDNNVNRNSLDNSYDESKKMWGLEWPHISNNPSNTTWIVKESTESPQYGVSISMEWCNDSLANRWTCYTIHNGNNETNVSRYEGDFITETTIPQSYRTKHDDYTGSGYSRGHLCPSAVRLCSVEQNKHTFSTANIHPQWQSHNAGIWERMETQERKWGGYNINGDQYSIICDTLYVVKAATIGDVTLNGITSKGVYDTKTSSTKTNAHLYVPKYFYMAFLARTGNTYKALAFWTEHTNDAQSGTALSSYVISIDELERRTGIDFFCNLPDDIEATVEATTPDLGFWGLSNN